LIVDLVDAMARTVPFLKVAEEGVQLDLLHDSIVEMLRLIEDASQFIVEYKGHGSPGEISLFTLPTFTNHQQSEP
jgi:hypothetical protein